MTTIVTLNNANINNIMINASNSTLLLALSVKTTGVIVILMHNIHANKNWSFTERYPVDTSTVTNILNKILNNNHIVFPDINISQIIY